MMPDERARPKAGALSTGGIVIFLLVVLFIWAGLYAVPKPGYTPITEARVHDLRGFDFEHTILFINTFKAWETYREQFYTPSDFEARTPLPPAWPPEYVKAEYATHRLRLLLVPGRTYGLSLKSSDYAMRIYIGGNEIDTVGVPGTARESVTPRVHFRVYYFTPESEQTDIVIHASNFVHREGAYVTNAWLGSSRNISRKAETDSLVSYAVFGSLLTAAMYHLALFLVNRRRKTELIFSVCCFLLIFMTRHILLTFLPNYNFYVWFRVEYVVHYAVFAMLVLFLRRLFPFLLYKWLFGAYMLLSLALILTTIIADTKFSSYLIQYYDAGSVLLIVWLLIRLGVTLGKKRPQNLLAFAGLLVLAVLAVNDIVLHINKTAVRLFGGMDFGTPVGMVFFIFCYAMILALDHAETERLAMELRMKEQAMAAENAALDRLNQLKTELMRTISHETRTPLAVISGFAEITAKYWRKSAMPGRQGGSLAANLDTIAAEAKRLADMMEEARQLVFAKEYSQDRRAINPGVLIRQIAGLYGIVLERRGTALKLNVADNLPLVRGSSSELTQVLFNLLRNADTHTEGGLITITAEPADGGMVKITVADTGTGIAPELLPRVFERGVHEEGEGSGYGLAICRDIITAYGGEIGVNSGEEAGTDVKFTLPIAEEVENGVDH